MSNKARFRPGSLEKVKTAKGPAWYVRFRWTEDSGKKGSERFRIGLDSEFKNKSAVNRAAQPIIDQFNAVPESTRAEKRRFCELINRYIAEEMPKRHSTQKGYRAIISNQIRPRWGNEFLEDVKPMAVRSWLKSLDCSTRYRGHIHGMMRILFNFAILWEWVPFGKDGNPMSLFHMPGASKREKEPNVLTGNQFGAVLAEIKDPMHRTMVLLAICLGLRCSELFALKWKDVLPDVLKIECGIVDGVEGEVKTIHSKKPLPLHPDLAAMLADWRIGTEFNQDKDWIFASPYLGGDFPPRPGNVQRLVLIPAGKKAGLPFQLGWHTFRHTYRNWLDELQIPLTVQRDLMRHADIRTTTGYGNTGMKSLRAANDRLIVMPMAESRKKREA